MAENAADILRGFSGFKNANYPEIRINCIRCGDTTSHLYFNVQLGIGNCKKCNYSPNLPRLIADSEHISLDEAYRRLGLGVASKPQVYEEPAFEYKAILYPQHFVLLDAPSERHPKRIVDYMLRRGLTWEKAKQYEIGYCIAGEYVLRLIVPIKMYSKLVSWQARDITGTSERKYKNPIGSEFAQYLFNYDLARTFDEMILVEGVFDAIAVGNNCVCTFGKKIGEAQKFLILKSGVKRLSILFDSDATSEDIKYVTEMAKFIPTRLVLLPSGLDPDEVDREFLNQLFNWAPYSDEEDFDAYMQRVRLAGSLEEWMKSLRKPVSRGA